MSEQTHPEQPDVVIVGAGIAGLACARQLTRAGLKVSLLEKSRGLGGRLATRRVEGSPPWILDHGVQYFSADTDSFHRALKEPLAQGIVTEWTRALHRLTPKGLLSPSVNSQDPRYICPQGMTSLAKYLGQSLTIYTQARLTQITPTPQGWHLSTDNGLTFTTPALVMALPAPQILALIDGILPPDSTLKPLLQSAHYHPCIAVLAGYASGIPVPDWKGVRCDDDPKLAWISLDSSKRPQPAPPALVLHSTPAWAAQHADLSGDALHQLGRDLLAYAANRLQAPWMKDPLWLQVHGWRYSLPVEILGMASLATRVPVSGSLDLPLVCAGDWCAGDRVEGAWISGQDAADRLLELLGSPNFPSHFVPLTD